MVTNLRLTAEVDLLCQDVQSLHEARLMIGPQLSSHLLFLPESWKWKITRKNERKLILEGPMFH